MCQMKTDYRFGLESSLETNEISTQIYVSHTPLLGLVWQIRFAQLTKETNGTR